MKNKMLREIIRLVYELIRHGFYSTDELAPMIPSMLILLDGRGDRIRPHDEPSVERYQKKVMIDCDTVVVMECKLWILRMLQLICTVRLDLRLSALLNVYFDVWHAKDVETERIKRRF